MSHRWTDKELKYLRKYYPRMDTGKVAERLNRTKNAVINMAAKLEITKKEFRRWAKWEDKSLYRSQTVFHCQNT